MILPPEIDDTVVLVSNRYYLRSGERVPKANAEVLLELLKEWGMSKVVDPPFGNPLYDTEYLARRYMTYYALGYNPSMYIPSDYGTSWEDVKDILKEYNPTLPLTQASLRVWLTPEQVRARLGDI